jgi:hypothetical protein
MKRPVVVVRNECGRYDYFVCAMTTTVLQLKNRQSYNDSFKKEVLLKIIVGPEIPVCEEHLN